MEISMDVTIPIKVSTAIKLKNYCVTFIENGIGLLLLSIMSLMVFVAVSIIGWLLASGLCLVIGAPVAWYMKDIPSSFITVTFIIVLNCITFGYCIIRMGFLNIHFLPDNESPKKKSFL